MLDLLGLNTETKIFIRLYIMPTYFDPLSFKLHADRYPSLGEAPKIA
jgi:hypothetical protein